jgi:hypothetical protein
MNRVANVAQASLVGSVLPGIHRPGAAPPEFTVQASDGIGRTPGRPLARGSEMQAASPGSGG